MPVYELNFRLFLIIINICCDSRLVFVCSVISPSLHQQVSPFPLCDGADTHAVQLTLHVGQVRHLRTQVSNKQVNSLVCVCVRGSRRSEVRCYQAVGVDDGLVVVRLMSENNGLMEEPRGGLQLTPMHAELRHTELSVLLLSHRCNSVTLGLRVFTEIFHFRFFKIPPTCKR